jgi:ribonuclease T2
MFGLAWNRVFLSPAWFILAILAVSDVRAAENPPDMQKKSSIKENASSRTKSVLGVSWMPGFCEKQSKTPECIRQTATSSDAQQFSLSGLWRIRKTYCGVDAGLRDIDKKKNWLEMPELSLADDVKLQLANAMPGVASGYDRHQWVKYGTCSGMVAEDYYGRALQMLGVLNGSEVRRLFVDNLGATITEAEVKAAFNASFGPDAGDRVKMRCSKDGERRVITGLTIGLGDLQDAEDGADLSAMIAAAGETKFGCVEGVVDEAGLQ